MAVNMVESSSVKLFLFLQKYYPAIGLHSPPPHQIRSSFNWKNGIFVISLAKSIVSVMAFTLFEAKATLACEMSMFILACLILGLTLYLIPIWQMGNTSEFIGNCEAIISKSVHQNLTHIIFSIVKFDLVFNHFSHF